MSKISFLFLPIFLVGCTCLPFSPPSGKTPIDGSLSYTSMTTYLEMDVKGNPKWNGWIEIADENQTLNYSITPTSPHVTINKETGEIMVSAKTLFSNNYVVTATGYGDYQESVSTTLSVEVMPPFLHNITNIIDAGSMELYGPYDFAMTEIGGITYLYVMGYYDDGVGVLSMNDDGTLANIQNISDTDTLEIKGARSAALVREGGDIFLYVVGMHDDGMSVFSVGNDGTLVNVTNVRDDNTIELKRANEVTTAVVGESSYLFVTGWHDQGLSMFSVEDGGTLVNITNVRDDDNLKLNGPTTMTTSVVAGVTYLFVTGYWDHGFSVFSVGGDGTLVNVTNVSDDDTLNIGGTRSVTISEMGETTYLFVAGYKDSGVSVFSMGDDGSLNNVYNISDDDDLELLGAYAVTATEVKGVHYLFVTGYRDHGVSMFSINDDGSLVNVANITDDNHYYLVDKQQTLVNQADMIDVTDSSTNLHLSRSVLVLEMGGIDYLFIAGHGNDGVSVFSINP